MKLEGSYEFPAPPARVWETLLDPEALRACIPGVETLEPTGQDTWNASLKVGVGTIRGSYKSRVAIVEKDEPNAYRLNVEGSGGPGFVKGSARITLTPAGEGTRVDVDADGQVGGMVAGVGQRMLGGAARMLMNQFFDCMKARVS